MATLQLNGRIGEVFWLFNHKGERIRLTNKQRRDGLVPGTYYLIVRQQMLLVKLHRIELSDVERTVWKMLNNISYRPLYDTDCIEESAPASVKAEMRRIAKLDKPRKR